MSTKAWIIILFLACILTFGATKYFTKPERVIVVQKEQIVKYKYKLKEEQIKNDSRWLLKLPFVDYGITKSFAIGGIMGYVLAL